MLTPPRSDPGKLARIMPMTKTASNSRPFAWCTVITWTPARSGGAMDSPRKPISARPASRAARPRESSAGSASAISRAEPLQGAQPGQPRRALPAPRGDGLPAQPGGVDDGAQRVGRRQRGGGPPGLAPARRPARRPRPRGRPRPGAPATGSPRAAAPDTASAAVVQSRSRPRSEASRRWAWASDGSAGGAQPGHRGAHLAALEEPEAAAHLMGDPRPLQRLGDRPRLQADRAHEDRLLLQRHPLPRQPADLAGHRARLAVGVGRAPEAGSGPVRARQRGDGLGGAVGDRRHHGRGGVQDRLAGAVVDLQPQLGPRPGSGGGSRRCSSSDAPRKR